MVRLGRLSPVLDGAISGGDVDLFDKFASRRMENSVLYEGERFEGGSVDLVVLPLGGVVACKCDTASSRKARGRKSLTFQPTFFTAFINARLYPRRHLPVGAVGQAMVGAEV